MAPGNQKLLEHPPILFPNLLPAEDPGDVEFRGEAKVPQLRVGRGRCDDAVQPLARVFQVAEPRGWPTSVAGAQCLECREVAHDDTIAGVPLEEAVRGSLRLEYHPFVMHGAVVEGAKLMDRVGFARQMQEGAVEVSRFWRCALLPSERAGVGSEGEDEDQDGRARPEEGAAQEAARPPRKPLHFAVPATSWSAPRASFAFVNVPVLARWRSVS